MTTHQPVSINKIITAVVFISAALIASLFVFHMSHKTTTSPLALENGMIFSAPRDIKPFSLISANGTPFSEKDLYKHWTLLFFGFTHCASICPTTLDMLNRVYSNVKSDYPNLQVVLISLDPDRDKPADLLKYTQSFNHDFIGASGRIQDLRKLQSGFGVYSTPDTTAPANNYQLTHTASIMLINPQGQWVGLFNFGMTTDQFTKTFREGIRAADRS